MGEGAIVLAVEAAYRPAPSLRVWLQGIVDALAPAFNRGFGVAAFTVDLRAGAPVIGDAVESLGCPRASDLAPRMNGTLTADRAQGLYRRAPIVSSAAQLVGPARFDRDEAVVTCLHPLGIRDVIGVRASDGSPCAVSLCFPSGTVGNVSLRDQRNLTQIAGHVSAGLRLMRATATAEPDAVIAPEGEVQHAQGVARTEASRKHLRDQAVAIERARRGQAKDAIDLWRVLADSTWSLVEVFEGDGRRHYLARENRVAGAGPKGLNTRERNVLALVAAGHSHKLIAYELGLSSAVVSAVVRAAMTKLVLARRADLLRLLGDLEGSVRECRTT